MRSKKIYVFPVALLLFILSGCVRTGIFDLPMFIEKFNENIGEDTMIQTEELLVHDNTYYAFFPSDNNGEYMVTISEDEDGEVYECGICIVESIPVDVNFIESLFSAELYSLYNVPREKATKIFKSLKLNEAATYSETATLKKSTSDFIVEVIVNNAGTGIYIYEASK